MKQGEVLRTVKFKKQVQIDLEKIYPVKPIDTSKYDVKYFIDEEEQSLCFGSYYCNKLMVSSKTEKCVNVILGKGYLTEEDKELNNKFITDGNWQGGDGIFSFNLVNGNDAFDQEEIKKTLLVFGDTFVGRFDKETQIKFLEGTRGAGFLFDADIKSYIEKIWDRALNIEVWAEDERTSTHAADRNENMKWFIEQLREADQRFKKYMQLSH